MMIFLRMLRGQHCVLIKDYDDRKMSVVHYYLIESIIQEKRYIETSLPNSFLKHESNFIQNIMEGK